MNYLEEVLKVIFLFLGILYGFSNTYKIMARAEVGTYQMWLQAIGMTGFIYMQWVM